MSEPTSDRRNLPAEDFYEHDPRKFLALHPDDAEVIFSSQSSYGAHLTSDFRENVKSLSQVYKAIQRYLQGVARRSDIFYPHLEDIYKDLQMHKRSISDKIPMPTEEQLDRLCVNLAAQNPPFIHILRELALTPDNQLTFDSLYVAPTEKHPDKVIVGYKGTIETSMKILRDVVNREELAQDYSEGFAGARNANEVPVHKGRVDQILRGMYLTEKRYSNITQADIQHLRTINQELFRRLYKPLLVQGIRERVFLSFSCDDVRKAGFNGSEKIFDIILFNNSEQIKTRFAALRAYIKPEFLGVFLNSSDTEDANAKLKAGELDELGYISQLSTRAYEKAIKATPPPLNLIQLVVETRKLADWMRSTTKQEAKSAEQKELEDIIERVKATPIFRVRNSKNISVADRYLKLMLKNKVPPILACTDPYDDPRNISDETDLAIYDNIFLVYRDRKKTAEAVDMAVDLYEKSGDTFMLHVLENAFGLGMKPESELKSYVAPVYLDKLRHTLKQAYAKHLPWWSRLMMFLTSGEMSEERTEMLRAQLRASQTRKTERLHSIQSKSDEKRARRDVQRVARERVATREEAGAPKKDEGRELDSVEKQVFGGLQQFTENEWNRGRFPTRDDLLESAGANQEKIARHLLGMIDVGAASVSDIVRIPTGYENIYGRRSYIMKHRDELLESLKARMEKENVIVDGNRKLALRDEGSKKETDKAVHDFIKFRMK